MGRKSNPDMSYLEIEKLFDKKKGRALNEDIEEIPFDVSDEKKTTKPMQGLNLVRPVPKKGTKFEATNKPVEADAKSSIQPIKKATKETKSSVPDVILRKPSIFNEDDGGNKKSSRFGLKPNLSLKMGKEPQKERFSDITLLKKPEPMTISPELGEGDGHSDSTDGEGGVVDEIKDKSLNYASASAGRSDSAPLLQKPELRKLNFNREGEQESSKEHNELSSSNVINENNLDVSNSDNQLVTASGSNLNQIQGTKQKEFALDKGSAIGNLISLQLGYSCYNVSYVAGILKD